MTRKPGRELFHSLDPTTAEQLAERLRIKYADLDEGKRVRKVVVDPFFDHVTDVNDYLLVSTIADVLPETDLEIEDLVWCKTRHELVSRVLTEYLESITVRDLFRTNDITGFAGATYQFEASQSMEPMAPVSEGDQFPTEPLEYETKTVEALTIGGKNPIGSFDPRSKSLAGFGNEMVEAIIREVTGTFPNESTHHEAEIFDLYEHIMDGGFRPDLAVIGNDVLGDEEREHELDCALMDGEILESEHLPDTEVILADTSHLGYECIWDEFEIEANPARLITSDPITIADQVEENPFIPFYARICGRMNWIVTGRNALARTTL